MRTTVDVMEAARLGEPCTEEELRLCIVSMRSSMILSHMDHAKWATGLDDSSFSIKRKANAHWKNVNVGWNVPLDKRVSPHDWPGNPDVRERMELTNNVWEKAQEQGEG